ncbi:hypothetical protein D9M68_850170 [compost metagenome]
MLPGLAGWNSALLGTVNGAVALGNETPRKPRPEVGSPVLRARSVLLRLWAVMLSCWAPESVPPAWPMSSLMSGLVQSYEPSCQVCVVFRKRWVRLRVWPTLTTAAPAACMSSTAPAWMSAYRLVSALVMSSRMLAPDRIDAGAPAPGLSRSSTTLWRAVRVSSIPS